MDYRNDKLNEIHRDTWPNLGWAAKETKNDDLCASNLTGKEITAPLDQKREPAQYAKEKLNTKLNSCLSDTKTQNR
jgi:hypothetical protein